MSIIKLPESLNHLENEIKIDTLADVIKFEILMELYKNSTLEELQNNIKKIYGKEAYIYIGHA
jgi:hypothetical protein